MKVSLEKSDFGWALKRTDGNGELSVETKIHVFVIWDYSTWKTGAPQKRFKDHIKTTLKKCTITNSSMENLASNRQGWRDTCRTGAKQLNNELNKTVERRRLRRHEQPNVDGNFMTTKTSPLCSSVYLIIELRSSCAPGCYQPCLLETRFSPLEGVMLHFFSVVLIWPLNHFWGASVLHVSSVSSL